MKYRHFVLSLLLAAMLVFINLGILSAESLNEYFDSPQITSIDPNIAYNDTNTAITILGENFANGAEVKLMGNPHLVDGCLEDPFANQVFVDGNYAYIAAGLPGIIIIDIKNKREPLETSFWDTPGYAEGIYVSGNYAFVADGDSGLRIIDITDKEHPLKVASCNTSDYASSVYVSGDYAYVADEQGGIKIIQAFYSYKNVSVHDLQTITFTIPSGLQAGVYDLVVTNPDGQKASLPEGFEVIAPLSPVIDMINNIKVTEGKTISITVRAEQTVTLAPHAIDEDISETLTFAFSGWMTTNENQLPMKT